LGQYLKSWKKRWKKETQKIKFCELVASWQKEEMTKKPWV